MHYKKTFLLVISIVLASSISTAQNTEFDLYIIGGRNAEKIKVSVNDSLYFFKFMRKRIGVKNNPNIAHVRVIINHPLQEDDVLPIYIYRNSGSGRTFKKSAGVDYIPYLDCNPKYLFILKSHYVKKKYSYTYRWSNKQLIDYPPYDIEKDAIYFKPDTVLPNTGVNFFYKF